MRFQFQGASVCLVVLIIYYGTGVHWVYYLGVSCRRFLLVGFTQLYITWNGHPSWPDVPLFCLFKRSLGHFASKSPKANIRLIKKALSVTVVLTLQLANRQVFQKGSVCENTAGYMDCSTQTLLIMAGGPKTCQRFSFGSV